jgi:hypothetical protein
MKETKNIIVKTIVWAITIGGGLFVGQNLITGEELVTIENLIAGGTVGISQALLVALVLFKDILPTKTATALQNNVIPAVQQLEQNNALRFDNIEKTLALVLNLLNENKELREQLLNENNEA